MFGCLRLLHDRRFLQNFHCVQISRKITTSFTDQENFSISCREENISEVFARSQVHKEEYTIGAMKLTLLTSGAKHFQKLKILQSNFFIFVCRQISWGNKTKLFQHEPSSLIVYVQTDHQHKLAVHFFSVLRRWEKYTPFLSSWWINSGTPQPFWLIFFAVWITTRLSRAKTQNFAKFPRHRWF